MPVIDLTPHRLSYLVSQPGYEDDNGDWHEAIEEWSEPISCHAVGAGRANTINYEDGSSSNYSYTVGRLPKDCKEFLVGEKVKLEILGEEKEYLVKGFQRLQLQSKIWV